MNDLQIFEDVVRRIVREELRVASEPEVDMTLREFGALLGRHEETIRLWCVEGRVPGAYKLMDREWRIPRGSLALLQKSERQRRREENDRYAATGNGH